MNFSVCWAGQRPHGRAPQAHSRRPDAEFGLLAAASPDDPEIKLAWRHSRRGLERLGWVDGRNVRNIGWATEPEIRAATSQAAPSLSGTTVSLRTSFFRDGTATVPRRPVAWDDPNWPTVFGWSSPNRRLQKSRRGRDGTRPEYLMLKRLCAKWLECSSRSCA